MSYAPLPDSKVGILLAAMREVAAERPVWTQDEAAKAMGVPRSMVPNYVAACLNHKLLYRRREQGGMSFSLQPFPVELEIPRFSDTAPAPSPLASRTVVGFVPPPMTAPRPGSDVRHVNPPATPAPVAAAAPEPTPAPTPQEIDPRFAAAHYGHDLHVGERPGDGMVITGPQTVTADTAEPATFTSEELEELHGDPDAEPQEEEAEEVEPNAFLSCATGEIILVGCEIDEEGRVTVPASLVEVIRRRIAWLPPAREVQP